MLRVTDDDRLIVKQNLLRDVIRGRWLAQSATDDQIDVTLAKRVQQLPIRRLNHPYESGGMGRHEIRQQVG
jgi:hypothetical protein